MCVVCDLPIEKQKVLIRTKEAMLNSKAKEIYAEITEVFKKRNMSSIEGIFYLAVALRRSYKDMINTSPKEWGMLAVLAGDSVRKLVAIDIKNEAKTS